MKLGPKAWLPAAVLVGALAASAALVAARPRPEARPLEETRPVVEVIPAAPGPVRLLVRAQGTVEPRTENELVAEVGGRLAWISPALESGGFFAANEPLARIEAADYEIALERARAVLARVRSERKLADASLARSRALFAAGALSPAAQEQAESQAAIAAAGEREAEAALRHAELELSRTELRVPFAGRVRERKLDPGQLVAPGTSLASVFAVDFAEVKLPIPSDDLAFLELPTAPGGEEPGPLVRLSGSYAGRRDTWQGRIVRVDGALDPRTRLVTVVARVADPYGLASGTPPLAVGLFVEAEIEGREAAGVVALPRTALRHDSEVVVVGDDAALHSRPVELLRVDGETALVASGLASGEAVVARVPGAFVEGMKVRVAPSTDRVAP